MQLRQTVSDGYQRLPNHNRRTRKRNFHVRWVWFGLGDIWVSGRRTNRTRHCRKLCWRSMSGSVSLCEVPVDMTLLFAPSTMKSERPYGVLSVLSSWTPPPGGPLACGWAGGQLCVYGGGSAQTGEVWHDIVTWQYHVMVGALDLYADKAYLFDLQIHRHEDKGLLFVCDALSRVDSSRRWSRFSQQLTCHCTNHQWHIDAALQGKAR